MTSTRAILWAKATTIVGFLVLLSTTYILRGEALTLSRIGFSADKAAADLEQRRAQETYPERVKRHQVEIKNHQLQLKHYEEMLDLYHRDYTSYAKRLKDDYEPPQLPEPPEAPPPAEFERRLAEIKVEFHQQRFHYFRMTTTLNWVAWISALAVVGGLLCLLMFDLNGQRVYYVVMLVLTFVFMIGPAMQSLLSGIVGLLQPDAFRSSW